MGRQGQQLKAGGRLVISLAMSVSLLAPGASPAYAEVFPPQLPSQEDMNRLQNELESTLKQVRSVQARLDKVVRDYEAAEHRLHAEEEKLKAMDGPIAENQTKQEQLEGQLLQSQKTINHRAASTYRSEGVAMVNVLLAARTFRDFLTRLGLIRSVSTSDSNALKQIRTLKGDAIGVRAQLEEQKAAKARQVAEIAKQQADLNAQQGKVQASLAGLGRQFDVVRAEISKRKSGFAFPVAAPYSYVNTFGAPRMEGSVFFHRHEGTDIFAPSGTPLLAVVDGIIENVGTATLGGTKLWLRSPGDNWSYYYAHLSGYAPGIGNGVQVRKGDVVGYVGNTGNARTTPPHLHFETRMPPGPEATGPYLFGQAANPFPILRRVDPLAKN
ncbi:MAG: murein hydrolase activator EnvC family protein [Actinomycetota bacterium]